MATDAKHVPPSVPGARPSAGWDVRAVAQSGALTATLLFVVFLALYWATRTHYNTFDAVSYANQIGRVYPATHDRHWLFHPHHLLFNAVNYVLWRAARALGYAGGPLVVMQRLNAVLGALGVSLFFLTLRGLMPRSRGLPVLVASGLALSFGYWVCATDGRANMPSAVCLLAALWLLGKALDSGKVGLAAGVGALAGLSVLLHESAALFAPVALAGVWLCGTGRAGPRARLAAAYGGAWTATVVVPYLLVATVGLHLHSFGDFRRWTTSYAELGWWWNFDIPHNLRLDVSTLRHAVLADLPGRPGTFLLARRVPLDLRLLYGVALAGWLAAAYAFCAALPLLWRSHHRPVVIVCLLWIGLYAAFFTVWAPGYFVFWVPVLAPIGLLLGLGLSHYRAGRGAPWVNGLVGLWIALYATVNWHESIQPHRRADASPFQNIAASVRAHTNPGDVILLAGAGNLGQCEVFIPYFADRDVISLHTLLTRAHNDKAAAFSVAQSEARQAWASGHAVYAFDELWHGTRAWDALRRRHPNVGPQDLQGWAVRAPRPAWTDKHGRTVWRLLPPPP